MMRVLTISITLGFSCLLGASLVLADQENSDVTDGDQVNKPFSETLQEYQDVIDDIEAEGGAFDPSLSEVLLGLGSSYHEQGLHPEALKTYKRSMHIARINDGLYSLSQEPMLKGIIDIQRQTKSWQEASRNYNWLYGLYSNTYGNDDPRLLPVLAEMNQWHMSAYKDQGGVNHLVKSNSIFQLALELATKNFGPSDLMLVEWLKESVKTYYYLSRHANELGAQQESSLTFDTGRSSSFNATVINGFDPTRSYSRGRQAYERIIEVLHNNPDASTFDRASAYAELGDWFALFGKRDSSKKAYQQAFALLDAESDTQTVKEKIFGMPQILPVFPEALEVEELQKDRYVKVKLQVTARGMPTRLEVVEAVPEDDSSAQQKAKRAVRTFRFRPKFVDNQPVASEITLKVNSE